MGAAGAAAAAAAAVQHEEQDRHVDSLNEEPKVGEE